MSEDFTTARYREILEVARLKYRFATFANCNEGDYVALWRHDIDFSPHRALDLARMEADLGVMATYFVQLSSRFYNVFEPDIAQVVRQIGNLGHEIGLHFETETVDQAHKSDQERRLTFQAAALEHLTGKQVQVFSLHNPTTMTGISFDEFQHCGLLNASYSKLRERFSYCSDSNGIWRFRTLQEMLADDSVSMLYVLTHPEWWQPTAMTPRQRIQRCIDGRSQYAAAYYDGLLEKNDRPNIGISQS